MKLNINGKIIEIDNDKLLDKDGKLIESFDVTNDDLVLRTQAEETTFKDNIRKEGTTAGAEIGRKEVLKGFGIEGEGTHKSDERTIEAIKSLNTTAINTALEGANIKPDEKIEALNKDLDILKGTITNLTGERDGWQTKHVDLQNNQTRLNMYRDNLPDNLSEVYSQKDILTLMNANLKNGFDEKGGMFSIGADGQPKKDPTTLANIPVSDDIKAWFTSNPQYLKTASGGSDGGDSSNSGGKKTLEQFTKEQIDAGITPNSAEFSTNLEAEIKADTVNI